MSSIRNNLGLASEALGGDKQAAGVAALMIDIRDSFAASLFQDAVWLAPDDYARRTDASGLRADRA